VPRFIGACRLGFAEDMEKKDTSMPIHQLILKS
jgi:hypothetical protein